MFLVCLLTANEPDNGFVSLGPKLTIEDSISFRDATSTPPREALARLDVLAEGINQHTELGSFNIVGYADAGERRAYRLAEARATAIRAALIARGVAAERLFARGGGTCKPLCRQDYESCARRNRRVELAPRPPPVVIAKPGVVVLEVIYFRRSWTAAPGSPREALDRIAADLQAHPEYGGLEVQGHADPDERDPDGFARMRAEAIRAALIARGIAPERLVARGYGACQPYCTFKTEECRRFNRRVQFWPVSSATPAGASSPPSPPSSPPP